MWLAGDAEALVTTLDEQLQKVGACDKKSYRKSIFSAPSAFEGDLSFKQQRMLPNVALPSEAAVIKSLQNVRSHAPRRPRGSRVQHALQHITAGIHFAACLFVVLRCGKKMEKKKRSF